MTMKKQRSGGKKEVPLNLRVDLSEKAAFARAAQIAGLPLSAWIRSSLRSAAFLQMDNVGETAHFVAKLPREELK